MKKIIIGTLLVVSGTAMAQNFPRYAEARCGKIVSLKTVPDDHRIALQLKLEKANFYFQFDNDYTSTSNTDESMTLVVSIASSEEHERIASLEGSGYVCLGKIKEQIDGKSSTRQIKQYGQTLEEAMKGFFIEL